MRTIQILRCTGLTDEDPFGGNDPYVVVKASDSDATDELYRTAVKDGGGSTAEWANAVSGDLPSGTSSLTIQVWDKDVASDDLIGAADAVKIPDATTSGGEMKIQVFKEGKPSGTVVVRFVVPEEKKTRTPEPPQQPKPKKEQTPASRQQKPKPKPLQEASLEKKEEKERPRTGESHATRTSTAPSSGQRTVANLSEIGRQKYPLFNPRTGPHLLQHPAAAERLETTT